MAASGPTTLRQVRERELVTATRRLFDERGVQEAPIEEIARAAGIARGLIYRQFSSKDELYVLTVTDYLDELAVHLEAATAGGGGAPAQARRNVEAFARFCGRYPAFLDCALSLMQRPARELHGLVSESVWLRLGEGMARCTATIADVLRAGAADGSLDVEDPDVMANVLWTQTLGTMHLARIGAGMRRDAQQVPELFTIAADDVVAACVRNALRAIGA